MMGAFKTFIRVILTKLFGKPFSSPALTKILTGSAMISFDVFDTLIIRPSLKTPSDLFDLLHPGDSAYKSRRIAAERQARDASHLEDMGSSSACLESTDRMIIDRDRKSIRLGTSTPSYCFF